MEDNYNTINQSNCEEYQLEFRFGNLKKFYSLVKTGEKTFTVKNFNELPKIAQCSSIVKEYYTKFTTLYSEEWPDSIHHSLNKPSYFYEKTIKKLVSRFSTQVISKKNIIIAPNIEIFVQDFYPTSPQHNRLLKDSNISFTFNQTMKSQEASSFTGDTNKKNQQEAELKKFSQQIQNCIKPSIFRFDERHLNASVLTTPQFTKHLRKLSSII